MKFVKKPGVIDAVQWDGDLVVGKPDWFIEAQNIGHDDQGLFVSTSEGTMRANRGDWIILGIKGEIYPCKPDIFALTYAVTLKSDG